MNPLFPYKADALWWRRVARSWRIYAFTSLASAEENKRLRRKVSGLRRQVRGLRKLVKEQHARSHQWSLLIEGLTTGEVPEGAGDVVRLLVEAGQTETFMDMDDRFDDAKHAASCERNRARASD